MLRQIRIINFKQAVVWTTACFITYIFFIYHTNYMYNIKKKGKNMNINTGGVWYDGRKKTKYSKL